MRGKNLLLYSAAFLLAVSLLPLFVIFRNDMRFSVEKSISEAPLLTLKEFRYKELENGDGGSEVLGSLGYHFKDRDEIKELKIFKKDVNYTTTVSSKNAVKRGDETLMTGGIEYLRSDGYKLFTDKSRYFQKSQTLHIETPFRFEGQRFVAFGDSSQIDMKNKKIAINSVRATLNY